MIYHGDLFDVLPTLEAESIDACVTDPPYELGFMGKRWDASGVAVKVETWQQVWRVLKPGAHVLAFGGTRTFHRMTCAIEDAGFEIRDCLSWLYGSGFPKSLDVGKAIDGVRGTQSQGFNVAGQGIGLNQRKELRSDHPDYVPYRSQSDAAKQWDGWGTALKPSWEPIICARKPFSVVSYDWSLIGRIHHALGGLVCLLLSDVKRVEDSLRSSRNGSGVACASVLASAAMDTLHAELEKTDTSSLPATASTCLSIVSSWSGILGVLSAQTTTSITATVSSTTTALRILNSLLEPVTFTTIMPPCGCLLDGQLPSASSAETDLNVAWANWKSTLARSVDVRAISLYGQSVASTLANIAADLFDLPSVITENSARKRAPTAPAMTSDGNLSPSWEPIILARKPLQGTVAANVQRHGTGAINIDACRLTSMPQSFGNGTARSGGIMGESEPRGEWSSDIGRWPANVLLDEEAAALLDEMTGNVGGDTRVVKPTYDKSIWGKAGAVNSTALYNDSGGASRFYYVAKPSKEERNYGTDRLPQIMTMRYGEQGQGPLKQQTPRKMVSQSNSHPTVKPVELMRWLVRLVTPPGGIVLDPFTGSGTTGMACRYEQRAFLGIEREAEYFAIAKSRIEAVAPLFAEVV